jgi:hypothetical protein
MVKANRKLRVKVPFRSRAWKSHDRRVRLGRSGEDRRSARRSMVSGRCQADRLARRCAPRAPSRPSFRGARGRAVARNVGGEKAPPSTVCRIGSSKARRAARTWRARVGRRHTQTGSLRRRDRRSSIPAGRPGRDAGLAYPAALPGSLLVPGRRRKPGATGTSACGASLRDAPACADAPGR